MITLLIKYENSFIKEFKSEKDSISIGRKAENDIVLDNQTISGKHCKIYKAGDSYFIEDLNSTNGSFLNGKKILKSVLKDNDTIVLVKYSLVFKDPPKTERTKSPEPPIENIQTKYIDNKNYSAKLEIIQNPQNEVMLYELKKTSTYLGKQGKADIPCKQSNFFSSLPDLSAVITYRLDGYYLIPLKEDIVKHNGDKIKDKILLKDDDTIEIGSTLFKFSLEKKQN